ncbi:MAG: LPS biosynthesis protein [Paludibacter sp.]|nr:LPS biosynthesis protein [Paludibacter sp.]
MKILAITQARYGSTRLPAKILKEVNGKTLLELHLERILQSKMISKLKVATTTEDGAEYIVNISKKLNVETYQGSINDVLERFYFAAKDEQPDYVVRLTSDCPLIDPVVIDKLISSCLESGCDYASNTLSPTYPDGVDVEVFKFRALEKAYKEAVLKSDREHVTPYIWRNSTFKGQSLFKSINVENEVDLSHHRITVDTIEDFLLIKGLIEALGTDKPFTAYIDYLENHPRLKDINNQHARNEGYDKSILKD